MVLLEVSEEVEEVVTEEEEVLEALEVEEEEVEALVAVKATGSVPTTNATTTTLPGELLAIDVKNPSLKDLMVQETEEEVMIAEVEVAMVATEMVVSEAAEEVL